MITIGFASNPKKIQNFFNPFAEYSQQKNPNVTFVDIEKHPEAKVDIVFLKITDYMVSDAHKEHVNNVKQFLSKLPKHIPIIEPLDRIERLLDRFGMYSFLQQKNLPIAPFFILHSIPSTKEMQQYNYPLICKSMDACGTVESHDMVIAFNATQLLQILQKQTHQVTLQLPILCQQFINHNATLYKVYTIGSITHVHVKTSIRNFQIENEVNCLEFNSQHPFPKELLGSAEERQKGKECVEEWMKVRNSDTLEHYFTSLAEQMRQELQLDLLGFDVIIESNSKQHFIVDVNYFPSYTGIDGIFDELLEYLLQQLQ